MAWPQDAYVGQKVCAIRSPNQIDYKLNIPIPLLKQPVTISWVSVWEEFVIIDLMEYPNPKRKMTAFRGYFAKAFRPIQSTSHGMEILRRLQNPINHGDLGDVAPNSPVRELV